MQAADPRDDSDQQAQDEADDVVGVAQPRELRNRPAHRVADRDEAFDAERRGDVDGG